MKKKLCVGIMGPTGRVGVELIQLLENQKKWAWVAGPARQDNAFPKADVWIDFSSPEGFQKILKHCVTKKIPLVSGTTGLGSKEKKLMSASSKKIPLLYARNMSLGIALLTQALEVLADLENFDFQIEEIHHRHKKDAPSGTALHLQEKLDLVTGKKNPAPLCVRAGGVFGIHKVLSISESEIISFEHTAMNRRVFAEGALKAAEYLQNQKPGLYSMNDVIKKQGKRS